MKDKVLTLLVEHNFPKLRALLSEMNPADLSVLLTEIPASTLTVVFRLLPKDLACETFVEMDADSQQHLITAFSDPELKEVLDKLFVDDTVDIIEEMPANVVRKILKNSSPEKRVIINEILNYPENSVAYTGTHDNETITGWYDSITEEERTLVREYLCDMRTARKNLYLPLISMIMRSSARICIIPMQDYLHLGEEARMNFPSTLGGNWEWRLTKEQISDGLAEFIGNITRVSGRWMAEPEKPEEAATDEQVDGAETDDRAVSDKEQQEACTCSCTDAAEKEQDSEEGVMATGWAPRRECEFQTENE